MKITIIGSGIAGISSAYALHHEHEVLLCEKEPRLGGHSHTVEVTNKNGHKQHVDTGFIVFNKKNYPEFLEFLEQLKVPYTASDMSFGYFNPSANFYWSSDVPKGIFSQLKQVFSRRHWRFLYDITQFNQQVKLDLHTHQISEQETLGDYIKRRVFSEDIQTWYIYPMGAAIWSCSDREIQDYPARMFFQFWQNHHLLQFKDRLPWQTVSGGSQRYIKAFTDQFKGNIKTACDIKQVEQNKQGVLIHTDTDTWQTDAVVLACHADQAYRLLSAPTDAQTHALKPWEYTQSTVTLHTDASLMPPKKHAWASWNVCQKEGSSEKLIMTYYMNRLQSLSPEIDYFVTLNDPDSIDPNHVIKTMTYTHPYFNQTAINTQTQLPDLNNEPPIYFCGSYFKYGFHEDAFASGQQVAKKIAEHVKEVK